MNLFKSPWKISGIAGILFVLLSFTASALNNSPPQYNQDKTIIALWFVQNGSWYCFGHFFAGLAFLLFYFPFFAGFCERLREAEGTPAIWTRVVWAGAIMSPAVGTIAGSFITGTALLEGSASPEVSQFAMSANFYAMVVSGAFGGLAMTAAAVIIIGTGIFRRWLGWTGLIVGIIAIATTGALVENDPGGVFATLNAIAWLLYFLWIAAISTGLILAVENPEKK